MYLFILGVGSMMNKWHEERWAYKGNSEIDFGIIEGHSTWWYGHPLTITNRALCASNDVDWRCNCNRKIQKIKLINWFECFNSMIRPVHAPNLKSLKLNWHLEQLTVEPCPLLSRKKTSFVSTNDQEQRKWKSSPSDFLLPLSSMVNQILIFSLNYQDLLAFFLPNCVSRPHPYPLREWTIFIPGVGQLLLNSKRFMGSL